MAEMQELESSEVGELEAVEQEIQQQQTTAQPEQPNIPEKYRGKSVEEIVRMHQEAEKLIDRQRLESILICAITCCPCDARRHHHCTSRWCVAIYAAY